MNLVQPTPDMRVFIRQELREPENPEDIEKDVAAIREWLSRQPHLPQDMGMNRFNLLLAFLSVFSLSPSSKYNKKIFQGIFFIKEIRFLIENYAHFIYPQ